MRRLKMIGFPLAGVLAALTLMISPMTASAGTETKAPTTVEEIIAPAHAATPATIELQINARADNLELPLLTSTPAAMANAKAITGAQSIGIGVTATKDRVAGATAETMIAQKDIGTAQRADLTAGMTRASLILAMTTSPPAGLSDATASTATRRSSTQ